MEGPNGLFVSMPRFKDRNGEFKDYCFPCTKEARAEFDKAVLGAYDRTLTQSREPERRMEAPGPFEAGAQARAPELRM
jgi:stage V sporulation protein G